MSSSAIRGIRRKKSSLGEVKVAVVGNSSVGKTGLRMSSKPANYHGEDEKNWIYSDCQISYKKIHWGIRPSERTLSLSPYDHVKMIFMNAENRYKHEMMVDGEPVIFEILDTCPKTGNELVSPETLQWADGFLLVYSITDRQSFNYIKRVKQQLSECRNGTNTLSVGSSNNGNPAMRDSGNGNTSPLPMVLVANKGDMVHLRQISTEEGEILAKDLDCSFAEVAASEQVAQVAEVFHEVCRKVQAARRNTKQSLLDRVLGNKAAAGLRVYARGKSDSALPKD